MSGLATSVTVQADFDRAVRELKQSALGLAHSWQALQRTGWSSAQLRPVLLALRQLVRGCDRLRLPSLRRRAGDLETQLVPFVSEMTPHNDQARAIEAALSALTSSVLAFDLSHALPGFALAQAANDAAAASTPALLQGPKVTVPVRAAAPVVAQKTPITVAPVTAAAPLAISATGRRSHEPNTVVVLRAEHEFGAGLIGSLKERGHKVIELATPLELERLLQHTLPAAVIADARFLNGLSRHLSLLKPLANSDESAAVVVVISDRRDLGRRLLALRNGAQSYFEEPIDALEVVTQLKLRARVETPLAHRALMCTLRVDFAHDCARWLMPFGVLTRVESTAIGALAACSEFSPEVLLVDASLPEGDAMRLVDELRKQMRNAHLPVVLFAGANSLSQRERAIAAGADEYLIEPVKERHLVSVISSRLERLRRTQSCVPDAPQSAHGGLLGRAEFLKQLAPLEQAGLVFVSLDQAQKLASEWMVSALERLESWVVGLIKPRLRAGDLLGYYQDGEYLLSVQRTDDASLAELAERIRRVICSTRFELDAANPLTLTASVSFAQRQTGQSSEHLLQRVRRASQHLQQLGGNRCQPSDVTLAPALVSASGSDLPQLACLQPLLPTTGKLHGQFLLRFFWRPRESSDLLDYAAAAQRASGAGRAQAFERAMLSAALDLRSAELKRGRQVRLLLQIGLTSLLDNDLAAWITGELAARKLSGSGLSFLVPAQLVQANPDAWQQRFAEWHALGMRVGLSDLDPTPELLSWLSSVVYDIALLPARPLDDPEQRWGMLLRRVRERGAVSVVLGARDRAELEQLRSLRVDFALSDELAPATDQADFDFLEFARS